MGVPQRETQQTAYILIQGQFSFIHQLHDGEGGEHFGYGSGPESGFAGNGQIFLAGPGIPFFPLAARQAEGSSRAAQSPRTAAFMNLPLCMGQPPEL
jgi:hypothetical protein